MTDEGWFECPMCRKRYQWLATQAGRRVRCHCGAVLRIPAVSGEPVELLESAVPPKQPHRPSASSQGSVTSENSDHTYALRLETQSSEPEDSATSGSTSSSGQADIRPQGSRKRCPSCGQMISLHAVLCIHCGQRLSNDTPVTEASAAITAGPIAPLIDLPDPTDHTKISPSHQSARAALEVVRKRYEYAARVENDVIKKAWFIDVTLPLILIVAGLAMLVVTTLYYQPALGKVTIPTWGYALINSLYVVVNFVFLFFGVLLVARLFDEEVGTLTLTVWKLLALSIFCVATDAMFYWGLDVMTQGYAMLGGYVRLAFDAVVFFTFAGLLLQMEILELVVLFLCARLLPMIVLVLVAMMVYSLFT